MILFGKIIILFSREKHLAMIKIVKNFKLLVAAASLTGAFALGANVQHAHAQQSGPAGWFKVCSKQEANDICNTQIRSIASTGQVITAVSLIEIKGGVNRSLFQITVPSGRLIPAGIKLEIDDKQGAVLPYIYCFPERCLAELKLDANLVAALKAGGTMKITSTNFQNKENPISLTLSGFTAAYDGPPLKQNELQDQTKKLQDELRKKAEEARKKLQAAQEAAKQQ